MEEDIKFLFDNLISQGMMPKSVDFNNFKNDFLKDGGYRKTIHGALNQKGLFPDTIEKFEELYTQKKNPNPTDQELSSAPKLQFSDYNLSSDVFDKKNDAQIRTYLDITGTPRVELDKDGRYLEGWFGDVVNALPMGDFLDDQFRAFGAGQEDSEVAKVANNFLNENQPSVEQANKMLEALQKSRQTPTSDEAKLFDKVYKENGADGYAAIKAIGSSPSGAMEMVSRSLSSMFNWDNMAVGAAAAGTSVVTGAATGPGVVAGAALALPAAMIAMGANTDMGLSFANFFQEELGDNYTRQDVKDLLENKELMSKLRNQTMARGVSIAAFGALTAGIGTGVSANIFRNGRRGLRAFAEATAATSALDMTGGAGGEALAQATSGRGFSMGDIVLEGVLDPLGSSAQTVGGLIQATASAPSYKINKGKSSKAEFLDVINSMSDQELENTNFVVNNDEETFRVLDERMRRIKAKKEIRFVYGENLDNEQESRLVDLEAEKKRLKKEDSDTAKSRISEIDSEMKEVLDIYKTNRERIGILSAPFYSRTINSVDDAAAKRKTKEYKRYRQVQKNLAKTMGLEIDGINDGIGGYFLDDGTYLQELSSNVFLKNATYEQAIEYASLLGALTPETQESTIAGMIVNPNEGDASQFSFKIQDDTDLESVRDALDGLGIEYSMNVDEREIGIIDFDNGNNAELNEKIGTFVETLNENNINHEKKSERIRSKYIGAEERAESLRGIKENADKFGKSGESIRYIAEQAEKRNQEYLDSKKPKGERPQAEKQITPKAYPKGASRVFSKAALRSAKSFVRRQFLNTFYSGSGLDLQSEEIIRAFRRKGTATQTILKSKSAIFANQFQAESKKMTAEENLKYADQINDYLSGKTTVNVSPEMKPILDEMRADIDKSTSRLVDLLKRVGGNGEMVQNLINTLEKNKGSYIHKAYSAFKDTKYMEELLGNPDLARASINDSYDALILETAYDQSISVEEAKLQVDEYISETFQSPDRGNMIGSLADGKISSPFFKKKNKKLTQAFKNLLGEINDPLYNYNNTIEKISSYIHAVEYQSKLKNYLLDSGVGQSFPDRGFTKLELGGNSFSFLSGIYVPDDVHQAYKDIQRLEPIKGWYRHIVSIQGGVKYGKTILSPTTTARNYLSGVLIAMQNGENMLNPGNWQTAMKSMDIAWTSNKTVQQKQAEVTRLIELGIIQDGGRAQEIVEIINDIYVTESLQRAGEKIGLDKLKALNDKILKIYSFGDDFFKTFAFYNKEQAFLKYGMDPDEASQKAAYRVRKGQPTYSELPRNLRSLRRNPAMGSFVSFPYLILKAQKENLGFIAEDFKEGRTKMAVSHLANFTAAYAVPLALIEATKSAFDISDEEDGALKDMGPDYYKDASFMYLGRDEETNELNYFDLNTIIPNAQVIKAASILMKDRSDRTNAVDKIKDASWSLLEPFINTDLTANVMIGIATGQDRQGQKYPEDFDDRITYGIEQLSPGVVRNMVNIAKSQGWFGLDEVNPITGKAYTLEDEFAALLGLRFQTTRWNDQLRQYARKQRIDMNNSAYEALADSRKQQALSYSDVQAVVADYAEENLNFSNKLLFQIEAARKQGLTNSEIVDAFSGAGLKSASINSLLKGEALELKGIGTERFKETIDVLSDRPDLLQNMTNNLDMFQALISERNYDARVTDNLFELAISDSSDQEVLKVIKKASEDIYKKSRTKTGSTTELSFSEKEIVQSQNKNFQRYVDIYKNYKALMNTPELGNNPVEAKKIVNMLYEQDPEFQSLLMYKYLDGDFSNENLNNLNNMFRNVKGRNISEGILNLLEFRIKNTAK